MRALLFSTANIDTCIFAVSLHGRKSSTMSSALSPPASPRSDARQSIDSTSDAGARVEMSSHRQGLMLEHPLHPGEIINATVMHTLPAHQVMSLDHDEHHNWFFPRDLRPKYVNTFEEISGPDGVFVKSFTHTSPGLPVCGKIDIVATSDISPGTIIPIPLFVRRIHYRTYTSGEDLNHAVYSMAPERAGAQMAHFVAHSNMPGTGEVSIPATYPEHASVPAPAFGPALILQHLRVGRMRHMDHVPERSMLTRAMRVHSIQAESEESHSPNVVPVWIDKNWSEIRKLYTDVLAISLAVGDGKIAVGDSDSPMFALLVIRQIPNGACLILDAPLNTQSETAFYFRQLCLCYAVEMFAQGRTIWQHLETILRYNLTSRADTIASQSNIYDAILHSLPVGHALVRTLLTLAADPDVIPTLLAINNQLTSRSTEMTKMKNILGSLSAFVQDKLRSPAIQTAMNAFAAEGSRETCARFQVMIVELHAEKQEAIARAADSASQSAARQFQQAMAAPPPKKARSNRRMVDMQPRAPDPKPTLNTQTPYGSSHGSSHGSSTIPSMYQHASQPCAVAPRDASQSTLMLASQQPMLSIPFSSTLIQELQQSLFSIIADKL